MERYLKSHIESDLKKKMVFLGGARQVGKTTLAKQILKETRSESYLNWDTDEHRKIILKKEWDRNSPVVVFDELHKFHRWKQWLKGIYDSEGNRPAILVTGSARLDVYRKYGDSMIGRYHYHRLHPLSVGELSEYMKPKEALDLILKFGGFPEPLLAGDEKGAKRWRKERMERVIREDLITLENIRNISAMELLVDLLKERVGSPLSIKGLSEDLQVSPHTVTSWIDILERMYVVFKVKPYSKSIKRAIHKEYKIYFMDVGEIRDEGIRFENMIASHLLKWAHFKEDTEGDKYELRTMRDKEKREVDFCLVKNNMPEMIVEVKKTSQDFSPHLKYFKRNYFQNIPAIQVVHRLDSKRMSEGCEMFGAVQFLQRFV